MPLRTEADILARWGSRGPPWVSIVCSTYNHGGFLAAAISGVLGQITDFPFELIVRDDASSDGTSDVLRSFAERYPSIIRPIFERENTYRKGVKAASVTFPLARGTFIALCDGDDYWLDPAKLQKQSDFLREHPDFVLCHHDAAIIDERERVRRASTIPEACRRDLDRETLMMGGARCINSSLFFRNCVPAFPVEFFRVINGDYFLLSLLGQYGKGHFMRELGPVVYREHPGGVWSPRSLSERMLHVCIASLWLSLYHARVNGQGPVSRRHLGIAVEALSRVNEVPWMARLALVIPRTYQRYQRAIPAWLR